jgi:glyoxylase I family protein
MAALHHIALGAQDVARVATFYADVFELDVVARHEDEGGLRAIWLSCEGVLLMVERAAEGRPLVEGVAAGPFLLAFAVEPSARASVERRLEAQGAPIEARTDFTSYARDPEGNRVAVSSWPEHSR